MKRLLNLPPSRFKTCLEIPSLVTEISSFTLITKIELHILRLRSDVLVILTKWFCDIPKRHKLKRVKNLLFHTGLVLNTSRKVQIAYLNKGKYTILLFLNGGEVMQNLLLNFWVSKLNSFCLKCDITLVILIQNACDYAWGETIFWGAIIHLRVRLSLNYFFYGYVYIWKVDAVIPSIKFAFLEVIQNIMWMINVTLVITHH